jgi:hypothetical protein
MTKWNFNEPTANKRTCALVVASLVDGSFLDHTTNINGHIEMRVGGTHTWVSAGGTATNTGFDGHWEYAAPQSEANVSTNEVEYRYVDPTSSGGLHPYYAATLVEIADGNEFMSYVLRTGRSVRGYLRRMNALYFGAGTGLLGALVTSAQPGGSPAEFTVAQNLAAGTRAEADCTTSETP